MLRQGTTDFFHKHQIRAFDYPRWAEPLRNVLRENVERIAADNALEIEFVRSRKSFRKEDRVSGEGSPGEARGGYGCGLHPVGDGAVR